MWTALTTWITGYLRVIEWAVFLAILAGMFYLGYHVHSVLDDAATGKQSEQVAASIPQIITKTQTVLKVIHASRDSCVNAPIDPDLLMQLRQQ